MLHPKNTLARIEACQRKTVFRHRVREAGRVEVDALIILLRSFDPAVKVLRLPIVAIHLLVAVTIDGVQIDTVIDRDHAVGFIKISTPLVRRACFARIIARHCNTAAETRIGVLEAAHVISLSTMQ